jgi:hypothetical protein
VNPLLALVVLAALSGQAAPTGTLTLACAGTETNQGGEASSSEQISRSIIVNFDKNSVMGLSDSRLDISSVDETTISFSGAQAGWVMSGGMDRVTGWLYAVSTTSDPSTRQTTLSIAYNLKCNELTQ